ncbi:hypothetical protein [Stenotrophomonas sp. CFBP 13725]|uniref:DUF7668 domain-containing protein n=1 Tax=Stenotrophomonas sp. CFBP 13725 TaxID=2775297 RepID=UPI0018D9D5A0|nr:hypothetical protein [Stenotrophomonas sp. CFBP 13725]
MKRFAWSSARIAFEGLAMIDGAESKGGEVEVPVPTVWRPTLVAIVDVLVKEEELLLPKVTLQAQETWKDAQESVRAYGANLKSLPEESWDSSVCIWYGDFWDVLIDLYTEEEGRSDLVLQVHVYEVDDGYRYEIVLVYVP